MSIIVKKIIKQCYSYDDYREFLCFYFKAMKRGGSYYTIKEFSQRIGFTSHSYLSLVLQGKRNLTDTAIEKIIGELTLSSRASKYFRTLVHYNQEKNADKKIKLYNSLIKLKKNSDYFEPETEQHRYFEKWYYPVIRSLAVHSNWDEDYKLLGSLCYPKTNENDAKKAIEDLIQWNLLIVDEHKKYHITEFEITDKTVPVFIKKKARADVINNSIKALEELPVDKRYTVYNNWALSEENYKKIIEIFENSRREANKIVTEEENVEKLYTMLLQIHPISEKLNKKINNKKTK